MCWDMLLLWIYKYFLLSFSFVVLHFSWVRVEFFLQLWIPVKPKSDSVPCVPASLSSHLEISVDVFSVQVPIIARRHSRQKKEVRKRSEGTLSVHCFIFRPWIWDHVLPVSMSDPAGTLHQTTLWIQSSREKTYCAGGRMWLSLKLSFNNGNQEGQGLARLEQTNMV